MDFSGTTMIARSYPEMVDALGRHGAQATQDQTS